MHEIEGAGPSSAQVQPSPGVFRAFVSGVLYAALAAGAVSILHAALAAYTGSYLPWSVIGIVTLFWSLCAALAALALSVLFLPVTALLKGRSRLVTMPALIVALVFFSNAWFARAVLIGRDPLGRDVILNVNFLVGWSMFLALTTAALLLCLKRLGDCAAVSLPIVSILVSVGMSYIVPKPAGAFVLVIAPLALIALGAALLERVPSGKGRGALAFAILAVYVAVFAFSILAFGQRPMRPVDAGFFPDPSKLAALAGKPNVIIITLDTARADHLSICGYEHPTTPNLQKLAADCRFFPNATSIDDWTLPSHASLFTGKYPRQHGARATSAKSNVLGVERYNPYFAPLAPSQKTLASYLSEIGYNTCAFVANFGRLCRQFGTGQGFLYYYDLPRLLVFASARTPVYERGLDLADRVLGRNGKLLQPHWDARSITGMAESWVRANKSSPFFLFLNYMDPHNPYSGPPPFDHIDGPGIQYNMLLRQYNWRSFRAAYMQKGGAIEPELLSQVVNQYDGAIACADYYVGQLIDALKREGLYDDTLLVVTCDHGEYFGDHQLLHHGVGLYEGGVRIPILVKYPKSRFAGEVRPERVAIIDIFATVFDVLGLTMPDVPAVPLGRSARPVFVEDYESGLNVALFGPRFRGGHTGVYDGSWKYIGASTGGEELYDLAADPGETNNLAASDSAVAQRLRDLVSQWQAATPLFTNTTGQTISEEDWEKLGSLGYVGP
jgi:arylsulfatase A-like enzyme